MRAWVDIEMDNLLFNLKKVKAKVPNAEIMGVVKADAYSLGSLEIAKELVNNGVTILAVASLDEAMELRNAGITQEILVLGILLDEEIKQAAQNDIQITVGNFKQIEYIEKNNIGIGIHIKIDTGMGRLGFTPEKGEEVVKYCLNKNLHIMGIYSHLSDADEFNDEADRHTREQISKFEKFDKYKDKVKYLHILNSGGILRFNVGYVGNLVRPGICMYGMLGYERVQELKRVFSVKTKVLSIKTAGEDTRISYGRKGIIKKGETYATIGMGYADGLKKTLSHKSYVLIAEEKCPIIGEICMDMCMVKIPNTLKDKISLGDEVVVLRDDIIEDMEIEHRCACDILTGIGKRIYRVYKRNGQPYLINR